MFCKFKEGEHTFLLYTSNTLMHIIPKRFLGRLQDAGLLRTIFERNIRPFER